MVMTKRGIYHNLNESEYATSNQEVALFFSSEFYLGKFLDEHKEHRVLFRKRIARAMHVHDMNTDYLADVTFYKEVETRGFRVIKEGAEINWQNLHLYALAKMTEKSTLDWYEIQRQK